MDVVIMNTEFGASGLGEIQRDLGQNGLSKRGEIALSDYEKTEYPRLQ